MQITTERLLLREVLLGDVSIIHELNSFPEVDEFNTMGIPESKAVTEKLVAEILESQIVEPRIRYVYVIQDNVRDKFIGLIGLAMGKPNYRSAEIWYKIHPHHWKKGSAAEAVNGILQFGFTNLKLHRIEAGCATGNVGSIKVLEKTGFKREGLARKILPIRGQWVDNYGYAILEEDFKL